MQAVYGDFGDNSCLMDDSCMRVRKKVLVRPTCVAAKCEIAINC